jgi:hypothetical protein
MAWPASVVVFSCLVATAQALTCEEMGMQDQMMASINSMPMDCLMTLGAVMQGTQEISVERECECYGSSPDAFSEMNCAGVDGFPTFSEMMFRCSYMKTEGCTDCGRRRQRQRRLLFSTVPKEEHHPIEVRPEVCCSDEAIRAAYCDTLPSTCNACYDAMDTDTGEVNNAIMPGCIEAVFASCYADDPPSYCMSAEEMRELQALPYEDILTSPDFTAVLPGVNSYRSEVCGEWCF